MQQPIDGSGDAHARDQLVLLIVPPFQQIRHPALGVSQLKANLEARGVPAEVLYLNLRFAEHLGLQLYGLLGEDTASLMGEMIFSYGLFDRSTEDLDRFFTKVVEPRFGNQQSLQYEFPNGEEVIGMREVLGRAVDLAGEFCREDGVREILERDPWMVGFSSSFQQNCSSLALAAEVKRRRPEILTIMGGANCEGEMGREVFARFPVLDFVGRGECDHSFPELVLALQAGKTPGGIQGMLARNEEPTADSEPLKSEDLDALPHPEFTDYFSQVSDSEVGQRFRPRLVMETSRGCWWGAKKHCTFCGLNGDGMAFRSKSPDRALEEMRALVERYDVRQISVADNILDMKYFNTVLPQLAENPVGTLFYETKSNLTRDQVRLLARAHIRQIQPGIESLSDDTLKLMRKGVTGLQNVQLLKWCIEEGVTVAWNYLFGFPGEDEEEILRSARSFGALHHLEPPAFVALLHLDRFSPYFKAPQEWDLEPIYPMAPYYHVFPFEDDSVRRLAYIYDCEAFAAKKQGRTFAELRHLRTEWQRLHANSHLLAIPRENHLTILDTRICAKRFRRSLTGLQRRLYEHCNRIRGEKDIVRSFADDATEEQLRAILRGFVADDLMLEINGRYLSLATTPYPSYRDYPAVHPPDAPWRYRKRLRNELARRFRPRAVAGGALQTLREARARARGRTALWLGRRMVQAGVVEPPTAPPVNGEAKNGGVQLTVLPSQKK